MNNGRRYQITIKRRARQLRKEGLSHREIAKIIGAAVASIHLWTIGISLTPQQKKSLKKRKNRSVLTPDGRQKLSQTARRHLASFWKTPYTKKELLNKIKKFYDKNGRIPLKREFNMYREYQERFDTWNKAIEVAGFKPNKVIFTERFTANDGHICDSFTEKIIDDWLHRHGVHHERHIPYGDTKMTADFSMGNIRLEYFGLAGVSKNYDAIILAKRKLCEQQNLKLIELYPQKLFSKNFEDSLEKVLKIIQTS